MHDGPIEQKVAKKLLGILPEVNEYDRHRKVQAVPKHPHDVVE